MDSNRSMAGQASGEERLAFFDRNGAIKHFAGDGRFYHFAFSADVSEISVSLLFHYRPSYSRSACHPCMNKGRVPIQMTPLEQEYAPLFKYAVLNAYVDLVAAGGLPLGQSPIDDGLVDAELEQTTRELLAALDAALAAKLAALAL